MVSGESAWMAVGGDVVLGRAFRLYLGFLGCPIVPAVSWSPAKGGGGYDKGSVGRAEV